MAEEAPSIVGLAYHTPEAQGRCLFVSKQQIYCHMQQPASRLRTASGDDVHSGDVSCSIRRDGVLDSGATAVVFPFLTDCNLYPLECVLQAIGIDLWHSLVESNGKYITRRAYQRTTLISQSESSLPGILFMKSILIIFGPSLRNVIARQF